MSDNSGELLRRLEQLRDKYDAMVRDGRTADAAVVAAELEDMAKRLRTAGAAGGWGGPETPWVR